MPEQPQDSKSRTPIIYIQVWSGDRYVAVKRLSDLKGARRVVETLARAGYDARFMGQYKLERNESLSARRQAEEDLRRPWEDERGGKIIDETLAKEEKTRHVLIRNVPDGLHNEISAAASQAAISVNAWILAAVERYAATKAARKKRTALQQRQQRSEKGRRNFQIRNVPESLYGRMAEAVEKSHLSMRSWIFEACRARIEREGGGEARDICLRNLPDDLYRAILEASRDAGVSIHDWVLHVIRQAVPIGGKDE